MALTYNYSTGQITRDFVFKKIEGDCHKDPTKTTLIGVFCKTCPAYRGEYKNFILCAHHKKDDEGCSKARQELYAEAREEAIRHFYD